MLFGHDEGKNIRQLCNGEKDVVCIAMGGTGATTAEEARENLGIKGASNVVTSTLLWENPNPTAEFAAQDISLVLDEYDSIEILYTEYASDPTTNTYKEIKKIPVNSTNTILVWNNLTSTSYDIIAYSRTVYVRPRLVEIKDAKSKYVTQDTVNTANSKIIPIAIYGVKKVNV